MFRKRLRPAYSPDELANVYQVPHDASNWIDHKVRVSMTIALGSHATIKPSGVVADLSCGNAEIPRTIAALNNACMILGDFAHAPHHDFTGPIEETILQVPRGLDLFVCSETIEHLDDPDSVLSEIRKKAKQLLLSTPIGEDHDGNPEHYWGWDAQAVMLMLRDAGWNPEIYSEVGFPDGKYQYKYQLWLCS